MGEHEAQPDARRRRTSSWLRRRARRTPARPRADRSDQRAARRRTDVASDRPPVIRRRGPQLEAVGVARGVEVVDGQLERVTSAVEVDAIDPQDRVARRAVDRGATSADAPMAVIVWLAPAIGRPSDAGRCPARWSAAALRRAGRGDPGAAPNRYRQVGGGNAVRASAVDPPERDPHDLVGVEVQSAGGFDVDADRRRVDDLQLRSRPTRAMNSSIDPDERRYFPRRSFTNVPLPGIRRTRPSATRSGTPAARSGGSLRAARSSSASVGSGSPRAVPALGDLLGA